jgi:hypothetical protein
VTAAAATASQRTLLQNHRKLCDAVVWLQQHLPAVLDQMDQAVVKALRYKPEGHGFDTRWGERIFSMYLILPAALGTAVHSASNRNEYQKQKKRF